MKGGWHWHVRLNQVTSRRLAKMRQRLAERKGEATDGVGGWKGERVVGRGKGYKTLYFMQIYRKASKEISASSRLLMNIS